MSLFLSSVNQAWNCLQGQTLSVCDPNELSAGQNIWNSSNHTKHQKPRAKIVDLNQPSHTRFINTYNIR